MLYPIHVVEGAEARVAGLPLAAELRALSPTDVELRVGDASLREHVWLLPVIDAVGAAFPRATLRVHGDAVATRLLAAHQTIARSARIFPRAASRVLTIELGAAAARARFTRDGDAALLVVPRAPYAGRAQHVSADRVDGAQMAGLPALPASPRLRLGHRLAHEGRVLLRSLTGHRPGPLVVFTPEPGGFPAASYARVAGALDERIGARPFVLGDVAIPGVPRLPVEDVVLRAAVVALAAVAVGDDGDYAHVAAAAGAPTVILHGPTSPTRSGPAARLGASAFTTRGSCEACQTRPGARCLVCLEPARVADVAEELAARRWPMDRLLRLLP